MRPGSELTSTNAVAADASMPAPLCIHAAEVARLLHVSVRQVYRLRDAGRLPAPLEFGGCVRWSLREIEAWIAAGAPRRQVWEAMRISPCAPSS